MTKKILSLILCFSLIVPACVVTPSVNAASTSGGAIAAEFDFEDEVAWTPVAMHQSYVADVTNTVVDVEGRGKVLNMEIGSGISGSIAYGVPLDETDANVVSLPERYTLEFDLKAVAIPVTFVIHASRNSKPMEVRLAPDGFEVGDWYHYVITFDETTSTMSVKRKNLTDEDVDWTTCSPVSGSYSANHGSNTFFTTENGGYRAMTSNITGGGSFGAHGTSFLLFGTIGGEGDGWSSYIGNRPGSVFQLDNIRLAYGTVIERNFNHTDIPESGEITATYNVANFSGSLDISKVIAGYDKNGQMLAVSVEDDTLEIGESTITASIESSPKLKNGGRIETFLWDKTSKTVIDGSYGAIGASSAVGTPNDDTEEKMVRRTKANTFTVEGKTSASAPITVIAKGNTTGDVLTISHFAAKSDGTYSKTFGIAPALSVGDTQATVTVYGVDTAEQQFVIPVYSNWDAMITAFKAMNTAELADSFYDIYADNFKYLKAGEDTPSTFLPAISDSIYANIALLNRLRKYDAEITPAQVIDAALDLIGSVSKISNFVNSFNSAKVVADETKEEDVAAATEAIKNLITTTKLVTFDFEGVFNKNAIASALINSEATDLEGIHEAFVAARNEQKNAEQGTATAFREVDDATALESFFNDSDDILGIDITPFAGYWEAMYRAYDANDCDDPSKDVNEQIKFLFDYVEDYKVFMENITRAAKTNKNWEAIKAVLTGDNGKVTVTLAEGEGAVEERDEIFKRLVNMDCTSLVTVEAAYTAAWTAQAQLENTVYNEFTAGFADKDIVKTFLENYGQLLGVPATVSYTEAQCRLFAELYNASGIENYVHTKSAVHTLVAEVTAAEAFIENLNAIAQADAWAEAQKIYEGTATGKVYADYFGEPEITVTDRRELYIRIIDLAKKTPFVVLADVRDAFDTAHADQVYWEIHSGAYENPDDALLDFVSTAWNLDIRGNVIKLVGRVDGYGVYQLILYIEDGNGTPIFFKQITTEADGMFEEEFGLNPDLYSNPTEPGNATFKVAGEGVNTYVFSPFELYTKDELRAPVDDFKAIEDKDDIKEFFNKYKEMFALPVVEESSISNDYKEINVADDRVLEALLFVYNKNKKADKYKDLEECIDVLNGTEQDTGALALIATMHEMIKCLDDLTIAANEMVGDDMGRWENIRKQVKKAIDNEWIKPSVSGKVSQDDELDMYLAMAGKTYGYFATAGDDDSLAVVEEQYEDAYKAYAKAGGTSGGGGGGVSGGGGGQKPADSVSIGSNLNPAPSIDNPKAEHPAAPFKDISAEFSWAQESIDRLRSYGIIHGDGDGNFRPGAGISREEFLAMLFNVFDIDTKNSTSNFKDVKKNEWYYNVVSTAYNMGIVNGYTDGRFGIGDTISRADMAVMICRAMEKLNHSIEQNEVAIVFNDATTIPDYAYESISKLQRAGVLNGDTTGCYNPLNKVTRAESAVAFWPIYVDITGILPQ